VIQSEPKIYLFFTAETARPFAESFAHRLETQGQLAVCRPAASAWAGERFAHLADALAQGRLEHLVLILTAEVSASPLLRRAWHLARSTGVQVTAVVEHADALQTLRLPRLLTQAKVFDPAREEDWRQLTSVLEGPSTQGRVAFMAGDRPDYVARTQEFTALKQALLNTFGKSVALVSPLQGIGANGKTTLAKTLAHDDDLLDAYPHGVIFVDLGDPTRDTIERLHAITLHLRPDTERPVDLEAAISMWRAVLQNKRFLILLDDVRREDDMLPFLRGGNDCARLITTRDERILDDNSIKIVLGPMREEESFALLARGLEEQETKACASALEQLGAALLYWPLLLGLANRILYEHRARGLDLAAAVNLVRAALPVEADAAERPDDARTYPSLVPKILGLGTALLTDAYPQADERLRELSIFPGHETIPRSLAATLWHQGAALASPQAEALLARFQALELVSPATDDVASFTLHDVVREALGVELARNRAVQGHNLVATALGALDEASAPRLKTYALHHRLAHLHAAGRGQEIEALLLNFDLVEYKIKACGPQAAFLDYQCFAHTPDSQMLGRAIDLSSAILARDARSFLGQILGRMRTPGDSTLAARLAHARKALTRPILLPRFPSLAYSNALQRRLEGHTDWVREACFSPNGLRIATVSEDRTLHLWDTISGSSLGVFSGHDGAVTGVAFSPNGQTLATSSADGTARLWDVETQACVRVLKGHAVWVNSVAFSPDGTRLVTASYDKSARIWDVASGETLTTLKGHNGWVRRAAFSPDGTRVVTGSDDMSALIWDAASGSAVTHLSGHSFTVTSAVFSPDGTRILTASADKSARVWDAMSGQNLLVLRGHRSWISTAVFSGDGTRIVTSSDDRTARVWDARTGWEIATLDGHENWVRSAAFSPDGTRIVTTCFDKIARLWDGVTGKESITVKGHGNAVNSAAFSADGARVITSSYDTSVHTWNATTGKEIPVAHGNENWLTSRAFSPDGKLTVTATDDNELSIWASVMGKELLVLKGHEARINSAAFSPDGARIISASYDRTARVWDAKSGKEIACLKGHGGPINNAAVSRDGRRAVSVSDDKTVRIWDVATARELARFAFDGAAWDANFSPDGKGIVVVDALGHWHVLDLVNMA